jgi:5'-3' exonuclease
MLNLLIDGNNLAHRCRHAFHLSHHGVDVSVTYGFLRNVASLIKRFKPSSIVVCWDGGVPEFRRKAVPEYKANRDHGDPLEYQDFLRQVQELTDYVFPMMGVVSVRKLGAEADDHLYHASRMLEGDNMIVSGDKDLFQAIDDELGVSVYYPSKDKVYTMVDVETDYDIAFSNYVDWRALIGDSSDNIPGVPGIGEKTASKLFKEFRELTNITNAATGSYPGPAVLSDRLSSAILTFGFERICKNIYIMALYADRVGSRQAILDAIGDYRPANAKRIKQYLLRNAFVSLMDGMPMAMTKLKQPSIRAGKWRVPVIHCRRISYE